MVQNAEVIKQKEAAGRKAADSLVKSGMKLGLGTGSTAVHAVRRVAELIKSGELSDIHVFATSFQTEIECEKYGIPCYQLNSYKISGKLDLTIDGADEVDPLNRLTKGGGAALLLEKLAAYNSASYSIAVDESKIAANLGINFPVPVEVIPQARVTVTRALEDMGAKVILREGIRKAGPVITDNGNIILDILFSVPFEPSVMEHNINQITGVVENGIFSRANPVVFIAHTDLSVEVRRI